MQIFNQATIFACRIHFNGKTEKLYEKVTTNNKRLMMTAFARHNRKNKKIAWKNRRNDTNIHLFVDRTKIANYLIFIHSIFGFRQSQVKAEKNLRNSRKFIEIIYCHFPAECNCENEKNAEKYMEMIMKKKKGFRSSNSRNKMFALIGDHRNEFRRRVCSPSQSRDHRCIYKQP